MHRFWGLTRRQTVLALTAAAVAGVLVVALGAFGSGESSRRPAVWVFGTRTVAVAPSLSSYQKIRGTGFGSVVGGPGRVWMYDPRSRELGSYDRSSGKIERLPRVPRGTAAATTALPLVAASGGDLWLASSPGVLQRYDLDTQRVTGRIAGDPTATTSAVVVSGASVVSAAVTPTGLVVRTIDPTTGADRHRVVVDGFGALRGLAADAHSVWAMGDQRVVRYATPTLRRTTDAVLGVGDGVVGGGVVAAGSLYVMRGADQLVRVRPDGSSGDVAQLRGAGNWPPVLNAALTAGAGKVYALVPVGITTDDRSARLVAYEIGRARASQSLEFSSVFFAGGLAFSTR